MGSVGQYAILRFRPFPETGEFANIGMVVWAPASKEFAYKIAPKNFGRVRNFFRELEPNVLKETLFSFEKELKRIQITVHNLGEREFHSVLQNFTRPRETIFQFSEVRTIKIKEPAENLCEKLFEKYVGRSFVTKEYREVWMEKHIQSLLQKHRSPEFTKQRVETPFFPIDLPLVHRELGDLYVIKPLAFDQDSPARMFDHGQRWSARIRALLETGILNQDNILVPIEGPNIKNTDDLGKTYRYLTSELRGMKVPVVNFDETQKILDFAESSRTRR